MLDWMNHKLESRFPGRNTNNLRYVDETTLMEESEEELKSFLMRVQGEGEKAGFKLNIQKMKIMATSPITSWQIEEEKVAEYEEELKSLLMRMKEESKKAVLKPNIKKTKIMATSPITSWQIGGQTVTDIILGGFKITADGDCSHEIKRCLLLGRKVITNLDCILKSRDTTNKYPFCQSHGFSSSHVWM